MLRLGHFPIRVRDPNATRHNNTAEPHRPLASTKMEPFSPVAPNGHRSFPSKNLTWGIGEWNHYYIRAINGEVHLWVNGVEVSGGTNCQRSVTSA